MKPGEDIHDAAVRSVKEELGQEIYQKGVEILLDSYKVKVDREKDSSSYPFLRSEYVLHYVEVKVMGVPDDREFYTNEGGEGHEADSGDVAVKKHFWKAVCDEDEDDDSLDMRSTIVDSRSCRANCCNVHVCVQFCKRLRGFEGHLFLAWAGWEWTLAKAGNILKSYSVPDWPLIATYLISEASLMKSSRWSRYISALPRQPYSLLYWTRSELDQYLAASQVRERAIERINDVTGTYDDLKAQIFLKHPDIFPEDVLDHIP